MMEVGVDVAKVPIAVDGGFVVLKLGVVGERAGRFGKQSPCACACAWSGSGANQTNWVN